MTIIIDVLKKIETILNQRAKGEHIDKVSIFKQMLRKGAGSYLVDQYSSGRISKERLAKMLELEKYHVRSGISYERFN
ncbi:MAG: hypothetical protein HF976_15240 [ANME-2 cluster archaeon]|nr:hypothetical protein [ANME-2 cluster archaeon]MBC2702730.1 hypothetical protein [ANME-2 cluster archaeon]MBC2706274.1 hypothetical protein [ANME-2 cluster archaeon]MBC2746621.1 hypothetical protein [ANME-2 cluster archaeon]